MKKLFFGLLIVAVGAGAFFLLNKQKTENNTGIQTELITGKWKLDSISPGKDSNSTIGLIMMLDSNLMKYDYEFKKNGDLLISLRDFLQADSSHYEWNKKQQLVLKDKRTDSTAEILDVVALNKDSLRLIDKDSSLILFTRLK